MNDRIKELLSQAFYDVDYIRYGEGAEQLNEDLSQMFVPDVFAEKFAELLLRNLSEELYDVAKQSKKANREWADGVDHAAMLAQRMLMDLPQWPEAE